jgi:hypothetical protein
MLLVSAHSRCDLVRSLGKLLRTNKLPLQTAVREGTGEGQNDKWKSDLLSEGVSLR